MHQQGQKVKVHVEAKDGEMVLTGRLRFSYEGEGAVFLTCPGDIRRTIPAERVLYVDDIRSREDF